MTAQRGAGQEQESIWVACAAEHDPRSIPADVLQRRAMRSMLVAMLVMALGLPLHITTLDVQHGHAVGYGTLGLVWLSALATLLTFWIARHAVIDTWRRLRRAACWRNDVVVIGALAACIASWPALLNHAAPMYFDVAAMALAWIVAGQAQEAEIRQRFEAILEQLTPLDLQPSFVTPQATTPRIEAGVIWLGAMMLGSASATLGWHLMQGDSMWDSSLLMLATIAVACPCTLGIAASSACTVAAERATAAGWLIPSGLTLRQSPAAQQRLGGALALGAAEPESLRTIVQSVRWAIRCNSVWAVVFNLASMPFAVAGPIPGLVPAANMLIARLLIALTNRRIHA
jgi:cation transport ATPase